MPEALDITTRSELAAVVPHLLGFSPEDSLVCVPTNGGGPTARIDLPHEAQAVSDVVDALADAYRTHRATCPSVAVLAFSDQTEDAATAVHALAGALTPTTRVDALLLVDRDAWTDLSTGEVGDVERGVRDRIAAEFVGRGHTLPQSSRSDLAMALEGNTEALEELLPRTLSRTADMTSDDLADEAGWVLHTLDQFERSSVPLSDKPAARLVAALNLRPVRDLVLAEHTRENAEAMSSLWRDLTRRTPRAQINAIAELLAFSAWLAGNGAEAWVALDLVQQPPTRPLAELVSAALQTAAPPTLWESARTAHPVPSSPERSPEAGPLTP